ncbi:uncharacterized protein PG998_005896 [Apiospora kogelbergensis]|uniref:Uncharacterized protein n=1 Tax=Apiospora kogelbergensis TaxID=1337665 RepID=A0AAW0R3P9_9PEZI
MRVAACKAASTAKPAKHIQAYRYPAQLATGWLLSPSSKVPDTMQPSATSISAAYKLRNGGSWDRRKKERRRQTAT